MPYVIRPMKNKDIKDIMPIEKVSFGTHHWTEESFRCELRNQMGYYYVIIDEETRQLLGYCGFWLIMEESHVTTIAIHPDFRRKYLGEILVQNLIDQSVAKNAKWITLEVRIGNIGAQKLYYKYGFSSLGLRRKYYQDNDEDAIIMWTEDIQSQKFQDHVNKLKDELLPRLDKEVVYLKD